MEDLNSLSKDALISLVLQERKLKEQAILDLEMLRTAKSQLALEKEQFLFERQLERETIISLKERLRAAGIDPDMSF